ncbi:MAG: hypothetical protein JWM95_1405 [Gemmatimonadetes bacterium]|nr:hypothetical protein [Gemmatimonadota bacterium]
MSRTTILVDTNVIIEAVRTGCWNALTGGLRVETVEECRDEAVRGDGRQRGYIPVSTEHLSRLAVVHPVSPHARAAFALRYPDALSMDKGERDLYAHAVERTEQGDDVWLLSSADKASVRAAVTLRLEGHLRSLDALIRQLGARPVVPLRRHHEESWLASHRIEYLLMRR